MEFSEQKQQEGKLNFKLDNMNSKKQVVLFGSSPLLTFKQPWVGRRWEILWFDFQGCQRKQCMMGEAGSRETIQIMCGDTEDRGKGYDRENGWFHLQEGNHRGC